MMTAKKFRFNHSLIPWHKNIGINYYLHEEPLALCNLPDPADTERSPVDRVLENFSPIANNRSKTPLPETIHSLIPENTNLETFQHALEALVSLEDLCIFLCDNTPTELYDLKKYAKSIIRGRFLDLSPHEHNPINPMKKIVSVLLVFPLLSPAEDQEGLIFDNDSLPLLRAIFQSISIPQTEVFGIPLSPWRSPGCRETVKTENTYLRIILEKIIKILSPKAIVSFGPLCYEILTEQKKTLSALRSLPHCLSYDSTLYPFITTLHFNAIMESPPLKKHLWKDIIALTKVLNK